jgi:hypothetical protein
VLPTASKAGFSAAPERRDSEGSRYLEDQIRAGAPAVPLPFERRDAGIAAADREGDGGGGKGFLQFVDPLSKPQHLQERSRDSAPASLSDVHPAPAPDATSNR